MIKDGFGFCLFLGVVFTFGFMFGQAFPKDQVRMTIPVRSYNALAEALVRGCEATDERVAMAIENYCTTKHPLTKGTKK